MSRAEHRTIGDKLIATFNSCKYWATEPLQLRLARARREHQYDDAAAPLISVYIPTYNRSALLKERAVSSVLAQTYRNFELIVVGDHCTDDTAAVIGAIDDPRVRFVNLPERTKRYPDDVQIHWLAGPVRPANAALELVKGSWIARIDDDDIWTEDHLEVLLNFAVRGQYEFVSASYVAERDGKRIVVDEAGKNPRIGGTQTWLYRSYLSFMKYNIDCWRKSWNRVNDTDLQQRMYNAGVRMGFCEQVVAYVLPRPGEKTIGLDAYRQTADQKAEHFRF